MHKNVELLVWPEILFPSPTASEQPKLVSQPSREMKWERKRYLPIDYVSVRPLAPSEPQFVAQSRFSPELCGTCEVHLLPALIWAAPCPGWRAVKGLTVFTPGPVAWLRWEVFCLRKQEGVDCSTSCQEGIRASNRVVRIGVILKFFEICKPRSFCAFVLLLVLITKSDPVRFVLSAS